MSSQQTLFLVLEDHPEVAQNNCDWLQKLREHSKFIQAENPDQAVSKLQSIKPDLIVADLKFGKTSGEESIRPGLDFLEGILDNHPGLNVLVYSSAPKSLISLKHKISNHQGGFAVANKLERRKDFLEKAKSAMSGELRVPRELLQGTALTQRELDVLHLMCHEYLRDRAIAERLGYCKRTIQIDIRNIRSKLGVDISENDDDENARIALCMRARDEGFIG